MSPPRKEKGPHPRQENAAPEKQAVLTSVTAYERGAQVKSSLPLAAVKLPHDAVVLGKTASHVRWHGHYNAVIRPLRKASRYRALLWVRPTQEGPVFELRLVPVTRKGGQP